MRQETRLILVNVNLNKLDSLLGRLRSSASWNQHSREIRKDVLDETLELIESLRSARPFEPPAPATMSTPTMPKKTITLDVDFGQLHALRVKLMEVKATNESGNSAVIDAIGLINLIAEKAQLVEPDLPHIKPEPPPKYEEIQGRTLDWIWQEMTQCMRDGDISQNVISEVQSLIAAIRRAKAYHENKIPGQPRSNTVYEGEPVLDPIQIQDLINQLLVSPVFKGSGMSVDGHSRVVSCRAIDRAVATLNAVRLGETPPKRGKIDPDRAALSGFDELGEPPHPDEKGSFSASQKKLAELQHRIGVAQTMLEAIQDLLS